MTQNFKVFLAWAIPLAAILLACRYYLLNQMGFPDYDSVRNWEIVQQVASGNFSKIFHHLSPAFYLFYAPFVPLIQDFRGFTYLNALFNVAALLILVRFFQQIFGLRHFETAFLLLTLGTCVFLVYSARFFTIESPALFLFALILRTYYFRFSRHSRTAFFQTVALAAIGLMFNYKFLLFLPVAAGLELWHRDGVISFRTLAIAFGIALLPYAIFMLLSLVMGLPFYLFPATYYSVINPNTENAAARTGLFRLDLFYYFQYFIRFESPVLWLGIIGFPFVFRGYFFKNFNAWNYLGWIAFSVLAGMSLLLKAPRGLTFVFPVFYLLGFLTIRRFTNRTGVFIAVILLGVGYNLYKINQEIYAYSGSNYPSVVRYLKANQIRKLAGTVGIGIKPYLPPEIRYQHVNSFSELADLKKQGFTHLLLDDYRKSTNISAFDALDQVEPILKVKEPQLAAPLLFLEHSEFTGLTFSETMVLQRQAMADTIQLKLIRLP